MRFMRVHRWVAQIFLALYSRYLSRSLCTKSPMLENSGIPSLMIVIWVLGRGKGLLDPNSFWTRGVFDHGDPILSAGVSGALGRMGWKGTNTSGGLCALCIGDCVRIWYGVTKNHAKALGVDKSWLIVREGRVMGGPISPRTTRAISTDVVLTDNKILKKGLRGSFFWGPISSVKEPRPILRLWSTTSCAKGV